MGSSRFTRIDGVLLATTLLLLLVVQAPAIGYGTYLNVDEAYALSLASRLQDGAKLYEGAISQRGPLMYYLFEAFAHMVGWDNVVGFRIIGLLWTLLEVGSVFFTARFFFNTRVASWATVFTGYALGLGFHPADGLAINGEALQWPFLLGAAAFVVDRRISRKFIAGLLFGLAVAIKPSVALHLIPLVLWRFRLSRWRETSAIVGGTFVVLTGFLVHALATGTLSALWYYTVTYNRTIHLAASQAFRNTLLEIGDRAAHFPIGFFVCSAFLFAALRIGRKGIPRFFGRGGSVPSSSSFLEAARGFERRSTYLLGHAVVAILSAASLKRFFPHYFLLVVPFVSIVLAFLIVRTTDRVMGLAQRTYLAASACVCLIGLALLSFLAMERTDGMVMHNETVKPLASWMAQHSKPDEKIFVWGFSPWFYPYSHRKPASRFVFSTYVTGFVPWFWDKPSLEKARIVPGSVDALIDDLVREKPKFIVDAGAVMLGRNMTGYEDTERFLRARYCFRFRLSGYDLYELKGGPSGASDCDPRVPTPSAPKDWNGVPLNIPQLAPIGRTDTLPSTLFFEPAQFEGTPKIEGRDQLYHPTRLRAVAEQRAQGLLHSL